MLGEAPSAPPAGAIGTTELYVFVDDPADALARVVAAGGRVLSEAAPRDWGDLVGYAAGPDGVVVALARRTAS